MISILIAAAALTPELERKAEYVFAVSAGCPVEISLNMAPVPKDDFERGFLASAWKAGKNVKVNPERCERLTKGWLNARR